MAMTPEPVKVGLQALVAQARADQAQFLGTLSATERAAFGEPDHWSVRDHVIHSNFWRQRLVDIFAAMRTGVLLAPIADFQQVNTSVFAQGRALSWEAIQAESDRIFAAIETGLAAISEDDLNDPERALWKNGVPLRPRVIHFAYEHPLSHYVQLRRERGDLAGATAQQQEGTDTIGRLLGHGQDYGEILYNQACFLAQFGDAHQAITTLRGALNYAPDTKEIMATDTDLANLREMPEFQALSR